MSVVATSLDSLFPTVTPVSPRELLLQAQVELKAEIARRGSSMAAIERDLKLGSGYLSQVLKGTIALKLELVFRVLNALGSDPRTYFARVIGRGELPDVVEVLQGRNTAKHNFQWTPVGQVDVSEVAEGSFAQLTSEERDSLAEMTARDGASSPPRSEADRISELESRVRALEGAAKKTKQS